MPKNKNKDIENQNIDQDELDELDEQNEQVIPENVYQDYEDTVEEEEEGEEQLVGELIDETAPVKKGKKIEEPLILALPPSQIHLFPNDIFMGKYSMWCTQILGAKSSLFCIFLSGTGGAKIFLPKLSYIDVANDVVKDVGKNIKGEEIYPFQNNTLDAINIMARNSIYNDNKADISSLNIKFKYLLVNYSKNSAVVYQKNVLVQNQKKYFIKGVEGVEMTIGQFIAPYNHMLSPGEYSKNTRNIPEILAKLKKKYNKKK